MVSFLTLVITFLWPTLYGKSQASTLKGQPNISKPWPASQPQGSQPTNRSSPQLAHISSNDHENREQSYPLTQKTPPSPQNVDNPSSLDEDEDERTSSNHPSLYFGTTAIQHGDPLTISKLVHSFLTQLETTHVAIINTLHLEILDEFLNIATEKRTKNIFGKMNVLQFLLKITMPPNYYPHPLPTTPIQEGQSQRNIRETLQQLIDHHLK